jgi:hypothetical protein
MSSLASGVDVAYRVMLSIKLEMYRLLASVFDIPRCEFHASLLIHTSTSNTPQKSPVGSTISRAQLHLRRDLVGGLYLGYPPR